MLRKFAGAIAKSEEKNISLPSNFATNKQTKIVKSVKVMSVGWPGVHFIGLSSWDRRE